MRRLSKTQKKKLVSAAMTEGATPVAERAGVSVKSLDTWRRQFFKLPPELKRWGPFPNHPNPKPRPTSKPKTKPKSKPLKPQFDSESRNTAASMLISGLLKYANETAAVLDELANSSDRLSSEEHIAVLFAAKILRRDA